MNIKIICASILLALSTTTINAGELDSKVSKKDIMCLAQNIYFESRGEPRTGQIAVALVTLNRANNPEYPSSICGVVNQGCQFSWVCDNNSDKLPNNKAANSAIQLAIDLTSKEPLDITDGALFFHAKHSKPSWRKKMEKTLVIGNHIFYRRS